MTRSIVTIPLLLSLAFDGTFSWELGGACFD